MTDIISDTINSMKNAAITECATNISVERGVTLICVTKNELWRLQNFLDHYRNVGVKRFVFIDNDSNDGSREFLQGQPDVDLYFCPDRFNSSAKIGWIHNIMNKYGYDRWYLNVDADELIVYDGMNSKTIDDLTSLLETAKVQRARAVMIDMYANCDSHGYCDIETSKEVHERCVFFDAAGYKTSVLSHFISVTGGPRKRMFKKIGVERGFPQLSKYPLFFLTRGELICGVHHMLPAWKNFMPECILGLLHYKFSKRDFLKIEEAIVQEQYFKGSLEYKQTAKWFKNNPGASLVGPETRRYNSVQDILQAGLIAPIFWSTPARSGVKLRFWSLDAWKNPVNRRRALKMLKRKLERFSPLN